MAVDGGACTVNEPTAPQGLRVVVLAGPKRTEMLRQRCEGPGRVVVTASDVYAAAVELLSSAHAALVLDTQVFRPQYIGLIELAVRCGVSVHGPGAGSTIRPALPEGPAERSGRGPAPPEEERLHEATTAAGQPLPSLSERKEQGDGDQGTDGTAAAERAMSAEPSDEDTRAGTEPTDLLNACDVLTPEELSALLKDDR